MIDLNEMAREVLKNAQKREQNSAKIKTDTESMLKHCATEVVEAMEAWATGREHYEHTEALSQDHAEQFRAELADIICCVLIITGRCGIDIEQAINEVIEKNRKRAEGIGDKL